MAVGLQLRCLDCAVKYAKKNRRDRQEDSEGRYCWVTTSAEFWDQFEHWELPGTLTLPCSFRRCMHTHCSPAVGLPHFFSRSAVSSELFDFIVEMHLKSTSAGLAENVKCMYLF